MDTFFVVHRNGSGGIYSQWYVNSHHSNKDDAEKAALKLREENPAYAGWYAQIRVYTQEELDTANS